MANKIDKEYNKPGTIQRMVKKRYDVDFFPFYGKIGTESRGTVNIIFYNLDCLFKCQRHN